jgi:small subunit ribosomal protein S6
VLQRDYELTIILSTTLDEDAQAATVERVNQLIGTGGGGVTEMHAWGRRRLAYPIAHQRDGFYVTTRFNMPTQGLAGFENDLRLNEGILRHLVVRQDEVPLRPLGPAAPAATAHSAPSAVATRSPEPEPEPVPEEADHEEFDDVVPADEE